MTDDFFRASVALSLREWLVARGVAADDIPDDAEVFLRVQIIMVGQCRLYPGSGDKRFARDMGSYPVDRRISQRQAAYIESLWLKYRRQLRSIPAYLWPMGLARPPKDRTTVPPNPSPASAC